MVNQYRQKSYPFSALQWTGDNWDEMTAFFPSARYSENLVWVNDSPGSPGDYVAEIATNYFQVMTKSFFEANYEVYNG